MRMDTSGLRIVIVRQGVGPLAHTAINHGNRRSISTTGKVRRNNRRNDRGVNC